jgi:uncharacterized protein (DUF1778 family)
MPRGRPPKAEGQVKSKDLRIPISEEQKAIIAEAMALSGQEMAGWARPLLIAAAKTIISEANKRARKKQSVASA